MSSLEHYAIGVVVKDRVEFDPYITVCPLEQHADYLGELSSEERLEVPNKYSGGNFERVTNNVSVTILAKWLSGASPATFEPPMVCKGETVNVVRYGDSDKFYWYPLGNELHLRKRDKLILVSSNKEVPSSIAGDASGLYYIMMNCIDKILALHVDGSDGEMSSFDIELNGKDGIMSLRNNLGEEFSLSSEGVITTKSRDKHLIESKSIIENCENKTVTISGAMKTIASSYSMSNGDDDLLLVIRDLVTSLVNLTAVGNLGKDVRLDSVTTASLNRVLDRINNFL